MTTDPRSLREIVADAKWERYLDRFPGLERRSRAWYTHYSSGFAAAAAREADAEADADLAALRTALAANPELMDELLPAGYAEAASIVRALAKVDETEDWLLDTDTLMVRVREWVSDMSALRTSARAWVTEHPETQ